MLHCLLYSYRWSGAAGLRDEGGRIGEPAMAQRIEPGAAHFQAGAGGLRVATPRVEVLEDRSDEGVGQAVAELLFIIGRMPGRCPGGSARGPISLPILPPPRAFGDFAAAWTLSRRLTVKIG